MGIRNFLKGKVEKHGGVGGAAKAALTKPSRMMSGESSPAAASSAPQKKEPTFAELMASVPTTPDADGLIAIGPSVLVKEGQPGTFTTPDDLSVAVFRLDGRVYAIDNTCTHEDAPLAEGETKGCLIVCPYHDWEFDFTTGACATDPSRPIATFKVVEHDDYVWIGEALSESSKDRGGAENDGLAMKVNQLSRGQ